MNIPGAEGRRHGVVLGIGIRRAARQRGMEHRPACAGKSTGSDNNADFIDAGAAVGFSCFLKRASTVWCVHYYINGGAMTQVAISDVVRVSVEGAEACAMKGDGTVWCWEGADSAPPAQLNGLNDMVEMAAPGVGSGCAVKKNGASGAGEQESWPAGNGTTTPSAVPVQVTGLTGAVQVARASYGTTSCALKANGMVVLGRRALQRGAG